MLSVVYRCFTPLHPFHALAISLTGRYFSTTPCRLQADSGPSDSRRTEDAKSRKKHNEARASRYANDPEYRAKVIARSEAWRQTRIANDPEYRAKYKARNRDRQNHRYANDPDYRADHITRNNARHKARIASDPEYHAKYNTRMLAVANARYKVDAQYRENKAAKSAAAWAKLDPVAREEYLQRSRVRHNQKYADDFAYKQRFRLQSWLRRWIPIRELTWRTHDAELHADPVARLCSGTGCGYKRKLKLWMKRKDSDPALYDCYKCFTSDWVPEKVLPIGYEHVIFGSGEKIEPRPVPLDAAGDEAWKFANPSSGVDTTS